jgi:hypothetical protein
MAASFLNFPPYNSNPMHPIRYCLIFVLALPTLLFGQTDASVLQGSWLGNIEPAKGISLRLAFTLTVTDQQISGTMASPDQDAFGIAVTQAIWNPPMLELEVKSVSGNWKGQYDAEQDQLVGEWSQRNQPIACNLSRVDSIPRRNRPQTPMPPFPYQVEEVVVPNAEGGNVLGGTLTLPAGVEKAPAAILITGSGAQDRDETIMGHKPFAVIADYLTRQGIAVLRMDDRGFGKSTGNFGTSTSADFATDISAAVDFLLKRPEIDPAKIGLIGHSEGGVVGPMVAAQRKDIAYLVMLAGLGVRGDQILIAQGRLISASEGVSEVGMVYYGNYQRDVLDMIREIPDVTKLKKKIRKYNAKFLKACPPEVQEETGMTAEGLEQTLKVMIQPWYRYFVQYDPATVLPLVKCPVLAINGSLDLQVPSQANLKGIETLVKSGGNEDVLTREFPNLNHLFQTTQTGKISEYGTLEETFSPAALRLMGDWITEKTGK